MLADVRAAGAITLLFGPSTERLCHLTPDHLDASEKHTRLQLRRPAEEPEVRPQFARSRPGRRWLLPAWSRESRSDPKARAPRPHGARRS